MRRPLSSSSLPRPPRRTASNIHTIAWKCGISSERKRARGSWRYSSRASSTSTRHWVYLDGRCPGDVRPNEAQARCGPSTFHTTTRMPRRIVWYSRMRRSTNRYDSVRTKSRFRRFTWISREKPAGRAPPLAATAAAAAGSEAVISTLAGSWVTYEAGYPK